MTYNEKIIDVATGAEIVREYTAEEIAQVESEKAKIEAQKTNMLAEIQAKELARQAVLDKLGLTADEAAALLA